MSLYLCIVDDDEEELDGFQVGSYSDFGEFRDVILNRLEAGKRGSRFPVLMNHSDCDGEWSVADCEKLRDELTQLAREAVLESFVSVDGEPLIEALRRLVDTAIQRERPILFQ